MASVYGDIRVGRVFVVFDPIRFVEGQELRIPVNHEGDIQAVTEFRFKLIDKSIGQQSHDNLVTQLAE